ncbi:MAG: glycosyltransferase family 2 protein [Burkholderiales bacterium]|nr:MAG: glycosyltransferase family 2 protein [Burkholderiales bacterium]
MPLPSAPSIELAAGGAGTAGDQSAAAALPVLAQSSSGPLELAVVVPTFNERANLAGLIGRLDRALAGVAWELVVVDDDSPDGTAELLHELARRDPRVRCLRRVGRRGLSGACIEGMLSSGAPLFAVVDADGQHDEALLAAMLQALRADPALDVAIGTRYAEGGGVGDWQQQRQRLSHWATRAAQSLTGVAVSDPMSGFFMLRRAALHGALRGLSTAGFKLLLDLLTASPRPLRVIELPYQFRPRQAGESKLDLRVSWDFLMLLVDKLLGRWLPARLISFAAVGSLGVLVHLAVLRTGMLLGGLPFVTAQALAVAVAMASNFELNNLLTYRDQRLRGWRRLSGLLKFMLACSVGAAANVGVAGWLEHGGGGWLVSGLAGVLVGTVWNYGATAHIVWSRPR